MSSPEPILASNALIGLEDVPKTAVFVGATDGIGKAILQALVSKGFPTKIYIVGRNKASHRVLLEDLARSNPQATLIFVEGQISLVADAQRIASQIAAQEDRVELLFLSSGYLPFTGRQETFEGLEASQVVSYYSYIVFVLRLLPQLRRGSATRPARVLNILAAEESTDLYLDDLTLKKPGHSSLPAYAKHVAATVTLALKHIVEEEEKSDIVFVHAHPGMVSTNIFQNSWDNKYDPDSAHFPMHTRHIFQCTPEQAGQRCLCLATSAEYRGVGVALQHGRQKVETIAHGSKGSLFAISDRLKSLQPEKLLDELQELGAPEVIWTHIMDVLKTHGGFD
ncbi:hypothetical protein AA0113_g790 [Alternaria arborescens]|uniref:Ketoreductase (KR) domain-containing protein n=1 Tax=Alternaria arborescens TaxID=156630 RepID=A0A4Q4SQU7_9PLEO|nr:hypothetical protein AA0113_g790 [Alternaria arborescens]